MGTVAVAVTRRTEAPADDEWPLTAVIRRQWMMSCVRRSTKVLSARLFLLEEGLGYGLVVPFPAYGFAALVSHNENLNSPKQSYPLVPRCHSRISSSRLSLLGYRTVLYV